jgi:hypothetical protein
MDGTLVENLENMGMTAVQEPLFFDVVPATGLGR